MTGLSYCKRYRMDRDLNKSLPPAPSLPEAFYFLPWDDSLLMRHVDMKLAAFEQHYDSALFPALATRDGCTRLMTTIRTSPGFIPHGTWLIANNFEDCGTIQAMHDGFGGGAIQNVGVIPAYRGRGLGEALVLQALHAFSRAGLKKATLEVTAHNSCALRLYRRLGFRTRRVVYKPVLGTLPLVAEASGVGS